MPGDSRLPVTVLGLGPMGQALAGAFLEAGHPTTVWNRTPAKADALLARGARRAEMVADAVKASELVIVCVIDYDTVHAIVEPAAGALAGQTLVNLTADSPQRARRTAAWAAEQGIHYLDGAIMSPATTIGGPGTLILYSGPEQMYERHRATLAVLGGTAVYLGADPGRAAAHDVALLDIFWTTMSGIVHAFALAGAESIAAKDFARFAHGIVDLLPAIIDEFADRIAHDKHSGDVSTILSAAAAMEHIIGAARAHNIDAGLLVAAKTIADRAIAAGHSADSFSRLARTLGEAA